MYSFYVDWITNAETNYCALEMVKLKMRQNVSDKGQISFSSLFLRKERAGKAIKENIIFSFILFFSLHYKIFWLCFIRVFHNLTWEEKVKNTKRAFHGAAKSIRGVFLCNVKLLGRKFILFIFINRRNSLELKTKETLLCAEKRISYYQM